MKKNWQPINIILGLLIIGAVCYSSHSLPLLIIVVRLIPAIVLILTRENNFLSFFVLFIVGMTVFLIISLDGFVILGSAVYMFISTILRLFKVRIHAIIGLAIVSILGACFYTEYVTTFLSGDEYGFAREINNNISIELVGDTGQVSTIFYYNRWISPRGVGLPKGKYVYQVISNQEGRVVPFDRWPIFTVNDSGEITQRGLVAKIFDLKDVALRGGFNREGWFPLNIGDYIIQLIRVEKSGKIIVAESNFSIAPYDEQLLSKFTAYMTVNDGSEKFYDSYDKQGEDSVTVWAQSPPGEVIGGKVKYFMENSEGVIDKNSWIGINEDSFRTDASGEPVSLRNLSGNPLPGVYHFQIIIDGKVIYDLKYNCF